MPDNDMEDYDHDPPTLEFPPIQVSPGAFPPPGVDLAPAGDSAPWRPRWWPQTSAPVWAVLAGLGLLAYIARQIALASGHRPVLPGMAVAALTIVLVFVSPTVALLWIVFILAWASSRGNGAAK